MSRLVIELHAFSTLALVGLIWVVQLVIYPLFARLATDFLSYHAEYTQRITWIVAPLMFAELATATALFFQPDLGVSRSVAVAGLALCAVIWGSTFFLQVPIHGRLATTFDVGEIQRLVSTNWVRTFAWTARGVIAVSILRQSAAVDA